MLIPLEAEGKTGFRIQEGKNRSQESGAKNSEW
jgi:hypothetical protein